MKRSKTLWMLAFCHLLIWPPRAEAGIQAIPYDLDRAIESAGQIVCVTIESVDSDPANRPDGGLYPDVGFKVEKVLQGSPDLKDKRVLLKRIVMAWPEGLVPLEAGKRCIVFFRDEKLDYIFSVSPAPIKSHDPPVTREDVRRIVLSACLESLKQQEENLLFRREIIRAASALATRRDVDAFLPFLEDRDEWIRRAALAALLRATHDDKYIAMAIDDLQSFFRKYHSDGILVDWDGNAQPTHAAYPLLDRHYTCLSTRYLSEREGSDLKSLLPVYRFIARESPDRGLKELGFKGLCRCGERQDAPLILLQAEDESPHVRQEAMETIGRILGIETGHWVMEDFLRMETGIRAAAGKAVLEMLKAEWDSLDAQERSRMEDRLKELGDPIFEKREMASAAIAATGWRLTWGLEQALDRTGDLEIRARLQGILREFGRIP